MLEFIITLVIIALSVIVPTLLAVGIAWLFIRQGKSTVGIFGGLILIAALAAVAIVLYEKANAACIAPPCGELSYLGIIALIVIALVDAVVFLLASLTIARYHRVPFMWPSTFLIVIGLSAIVISVFNYLDIRPYFEAYPFPENAVNYYASLAGVALGFFLIVFAIIRARKKSARNAFNSF